MKIYYFQPYGLSLRGINAVLPLAFGRPAYSCGMALCLISLDYAINEKSPENSNQEVDFGQTNADGKTPPSGHQGKMNLNLQLRLVNECNDFKKAGESLQAALDAADVTNEPENMHS